MSNLYQYRAQPVRYQKIYQPTMTYATKTRSPVLYRHRHHHRRMHSSAPYRSTIYKKKPISYANYISRPAASVPTPAGLNTTTSPQMPTNPLQAPQSLLLLTQLLQARQRILALEQASPCIPALSDSRLNMDQQPQPPSQLSIHPSSELSSLEIRSRQASQQPMPQPTPTRQLFRS